MKFRYTNKFLRKSASRLPIAVFIAASMPCAGQAGLILSDAAGNAQATPADGPDDTILASGGTSPTPTVTILTGAFLTGDPTQTNVLELSGTDHYTVNITAIP